MASAWGLLWVGVCVYIWTFGAADSVPKAENVHWVSLDFKTTLMWTGNPSDDYTFTVFFSMDEGNWENSPNCIQIKEDHCDLTQDLVSLDRSYVADVKTEPLDSDNDYGLEEFPHTFSPPFNPYRESEISAVSFSVEDVDNRTVSLNITDPLTSIYRRGRQQTIRDILRNDLKYKISYYKSGSTGKRDLFSDTNMAKVSNLDAGQRYCFMVAAFVPSRDKNFQLGAWSSQLCTKGDFNILQELSLGALIGGLFILLLILILVVTVTVVCCRRCRRRKDTQTSRVV